MTSVATTQTTQPIVFGFCTLPNTFDVEYTEQQLVNAFNRSHKRLVAQGRAKNEEKVAPTPVPEDF